MNEWTDGDVDVHTTHIQMWIGCVYKNRGTEREREPPKLTEISQQELSRS